MTVYAYIRVSTDRQNNDNQRFQIINYCKEKNLNIDLWIEEIISTGQALKKRKLSRLLKKVKENDILITCMKKGCRVWTIKDCYTLGNDIQSKVLAFAFALAAEIEKQLISQRTKQSLARRKAEGKPIGRMKGAKNKTHKLDGKEAQIEDLFKKGVPIAQIARMMKCHRDTISHFLKPV